MDLEIKSPSPDDHAAYMQIAISLAKKSPPKPTNFCVGAVLVDADTNIILSTGYTLELPGNTHAEECCLKKFAAERDVTDDAVGTQLPSNTILYSTVEPCFLRLSGNTPCVDRIINTRGKVGQGIRRVYSGVREPENFVGVNAGRAKLEENGIECLVVPGFESRILSIATAGHGGGGRTSA